MVSITVTVGELKIGTIITARMDVARVISRLAEFKWFHKIDTNNETITPSIDDLLLRAQQLHQSAEQVIKGLDIPLRVGILEIMFKGVAIKPRDYELKDIENMLDDLHNKLPLIQDVQKKLDKLNKIRQSLGEHTTIQAGLQAVKLLDVNIDQTSMSHFYTDMFIINTKDYSEIENSLQDVVMYRYDLNNKEKSAVVIISDINESERIIKVLKNFNTNSFSIPQDMPQIPSEAYKICETKIKELSTQQKTLTKEIASLGKKVRGDLLRFHEISSVVKDVLETLRKPGGTKNFAVIQGYIPENMENEFKRITDEWVSITEEITNPEELSKRPTLFQNTRFVKTFEVITKSQGLPKRGEPDPTSMIALVWPIFYGIMFADLGHGLLLMGMGLLFKFKGQGTLSTWGMLIAISGAAAAISGVGAGEVFGFHIDHIQPFENLLHEGGPLHSVSWLVGAISVSELNFEQVVNILKVSLFLGIIHLLAAMGLRIRGMMKRGDKLAVLVEGIPSITLYISIVAIMMCAIGSSYDVISMYSQSHQENVPWVTVFLGDWAKVWIITRIAVVGAIASIVVLIVGGILHAKKHNSAVDPASIVMETLLGKTTEALAHTISYARIGIMLLVHAALLLTVNNAFKSLGGAESIGAVVLIVGGNIGIMMIEGLIVYIQTLRLHLYEYFTKWYEGGATPFNEITPETVYTKLMWKSR